jgi:hypothetical protein
MRIRDGKNSDPGWKKFGSGIRDKHPGSATLFEELKEILLWVPQSKYSEKDCSYELEKGRDDIPLLLEGNNY